MTEYFKFEGLDYLIGAVVSPYVLSFKTYEIKAVEVGTEKLQFESVGGTGPGDWTENLSNAQVFFEGAIKWDGCANVRFSAQDECVLHFCGIDDARNPGRLFSQLYLYAAEKMARADKDMMLSKKLMLGKTDKKLPKARKRLEVKGYGSSHKDSAALVPSL